MSNHRRTKRAKRLLAHLHRTRNVQLDMFHNADGKTFTRKESTQDEFSPIQSGSHQGSGEKSRSIKLSGRILGGRICDGNGKALATEHGTGIAPDTAHRRGLTVLVEPSVHRSEERRVGKECRS